MCLLHRHALERPTNRWRDRAAAVRPGCMGGVSVYGTRACSIGLDRGGNKSHGGPRFGRGVRESTKAPDGKRTGRPDVGHCGDQRMESAQRCCEDGARSISATETAGTAKRSISNNIRRLTVRGGLQQRSTMNLVVLGATGGTGLEVVRQALQRGHSVTTLVRSPHRLKPFGGQITVKQGDLLS